MFILFILLYSTVPVLGNRLDHNDGLTECSMIDDKHYINLDIKSTRGWYLVAKRHRLRKYIKYADKDKVLYIIRNCILARYTANVSVLKGGLDD